MPLTAKPKTGRYILKVATFRQRVGEPVPGQPATYATFHAGDVVELTEAEAERLLRHGAVEPEKPEKDFVAQPTPQEAARRRAEANRTIPLRMSDDLGGAPDALRAVTETG